MFDTRMVSNPDVKPGEGTARLCLSTETTDGSRRHRQFTLELFSHDKASQEVLVRLFVSKVLSPEECQRPDLDLLARKEVDTNFRVGLFDFPMIDNTRLSGGERSAVSLTALTPDVVSVALAYFPASRASLKDKPYYDEVIRQLVRERQPASPLAR
jgi:hypothetical protein